MKRLENESFEDYQKRRKEENRRLKQYLRGWIFQNNGTYVKKEA